MPDVPWSLPSRPDSPLYTEAWETIRCDTDRARAHSRLRSLVEVDFWAFCKWVTSFGRFKIKDPGHSRRGSLWIDEPFVFDCCRELQDDAEASAEDVFYNWARFFFKTELVTKNLSLWELAKDPTLTVAILTHKVDQAGEQIFTSFSDELRKNPNFPKLWPKTFASDVRTYPLFTGDRITVLRPPGPREPTFSIHSITHQPTSGHYRRIIVDDAVVQKTVASVREIEETKKRMRQSVALGQDDTITRWVGTVWDADDPNMRLLREGDFFSRRSYRPAYVPKVPGLKWSANADAEKDWTPQLRSRAFLEKWRRKLGPYEFSCQMQGDPVAKGDQGFDLAWLKEYSKTPREEAKGKVLQLIIDPAGLDPSSRSDFWVFRIIGLGADGRRYNIDLWRERLQLPDALDLIFSLVRLWRPTTTWIEEYAGSGIKGTVEKEQETRSYRFEIRKLPAIKRPKESRISLLQPAYRRGDVWNPSAGFGHGSGPRYIDAIRATTRDTTLVTPRAEAHDSRDTYRQFVEDEFSKWTPVPGSVVHDDALDCDAWAEQPEVKSLLPYPEEVPADPASLMGSHESSRLEEANAVSGWGW